MGDAIKDAFAARMKRMSAFKGTAPEDLVKAPLSLPVIKPEPLTPKPVESHIRMEGVLLKMSSGRVQRWQKRYFVLSEENLCYYRSAPTKPPPAPEKNFPLRLASAVSALNDRQFEIQFGKEKTYRLEAASQAEASRWVNALESIIAQMETRSAVDPQDLLEMDDMGSVASSIRPDPEVASSSIRPMQATVWEAEVDTDALDRAFVNWFHFVDGEEPRISLLLEATRSALEDMWSLFIKRQRGERVDVKAVVAKLRGQSQEQRLRIVPIANEYVPRLNPYIIKWLDTRGFDEETVELLSLLAAFRNNILSVVTAAAPDRSPQRSQVKAGGGWGQAWQTGLQELVDRISGDVEVSLIERLRFSPAAYSAWELPTINHSKLNGLAIYGPTVQLATQFSEKPLFLTSWFPCFAASVSAVLADSAAWRKGNLDASTVIAELTASALVAAMNSAWRRCYRRIVRVSFKASEERRLKARSFWDKIRGVGKSPPEEPGLPAINSKWENALSFSNETTLMGDLCAALAKDSEFPEIYVNCLEGLAGSFSALKSDVIRMMMNERLAEPSKNPLLKIFQQKKWEASPMKALLARTRLFLAEVCSAAHEQVEGRIITDTMRVVVGLYLEALASSNIKISQMPNLGQVMVQDEVAFAEFFAKNYARSPSETKTAVEPISKLRTLMVSHSPAKLFASVSAVLVKSIGAERALSIVEGVSGILELTPPDAASFVKQLSEAKISDTPLMSRKATELIP